MCGFGLCHPLSLFVPATGADGFHFALSPSTDSSLVLFDPSHGAC